MKPLNAIDYSSSFSAVKCIFHLREIYHKNNVAPYLFAPMTTKKNRGYIKAMDSKSSPKTSESYVLPDNENNIPIEDVDLAALEPVMKTSSDGMTITEIFNRFSLKEVYALLSSLLTAKKMDNLEPFTKAELTEVHANPKLFYSRNCFPSHENVESLDVATSPRLCIAHSRQV